MFMNSHFHIPHGLTDVIVATRTVPFLDNMRSVNVFVFQIEKFTGFKYIFIVCPLANKTK